MFCYRDMTFCPFWRDCANMAFCHRPLTDDVIRAAEKFGAPIARFMDKPECWAEREDDENKTADKA